MLDRSDMKGYYLVLDNAFIRTPVKVRDLVESRGYKCLYLPPYSPFLNPVDESWSKGKASVRRNALTADDRLSDRKYEAAQTDTKMTTNMDSPMRCHSFQDASEKISTCEKRERSD